jgi:cation transport regulator
MRRFSGTEGLIARQFVWNCEESLMPYTSIDDLPPPVRDNLPKQAQRIFKDAFNKAYHQHEGEDEVVAFKIAWAAVKRSYEKKKGKWTKKARAAA